MADYPPPPSFNPCFLVPGLKTNVFKTREKSEVWCRSAALQLLSTPSWCPTCFAVHTHPHAQTNGQLLRYEALPGTLGEIYSLASNSWTRQHEDTGFKLPTLQSLEHRPYPPSHSNSCIHKGWVDLIGWKIYNYLRFADFPTVDKPFRVPSRFCSKSAESANNFPWYETFSTNLLCNC